MTTLEIEFSFDSEGITFVVSSNARRHIIGPALPRIFLAFESPRPSSRTIEQFMVNRWRPIVALLTGHQKDYRADFFDAVTQSLLHTETVP
jgi:hypothetical protein